VPTILITGANRGIGLEFARVFAEEGWRVHGCCRHPEKAKALKAIEGEVICHRMDVTDGLQVAGVARELADEPIDLLLNNAGVLEKRADFGDTPFSDWAGVLQVNTIAPLRLAERFVKHVAAGDRKLIVNISSKMGSIGYNDAGGEYVYRSSKAALNMVSKGLSVDLAPKGITVVAFHPGWVQTDMGGPGARLTPQESVAAMCAVIANLGPEDSGKFLNYDGSELPW
jgi:NAD(P)-dependent dehydrogenase (short-subunit alcohol dehydrogenase family)